MKIEFEIGGSTITPGKQGLHFQPEKQQTEFETSWSLTPDIGSGTVQKVELRPGFDLYIANYRVKESLTTRFEYHRPAFGFAFRLSGKTKTLSSHIPPRVFNKQGESPIFYYPDQSGSTEDLKNSHRQSVSLLVEPDLLHSLLRRTFDHLPMDLKTFLEGSVQGNYRRDGRITPMISQVLDQLFNCSLDGAIRRLFLESKAMELIALRLEQMTVSKGADGKSHELRPSDVEKIHFAASQLCLDLENPPTLFELAASTGISHAKLNRGFRQVFGTTAFGYLRQNRLRQAKKLLEEGRFNVTETAFAVGYNSLSSFARAFRAQYGCNPHACIGKTGHSANRPRIFPFISDSKKIIRD